MQSIILRTPIAFSRAPIRLPAAPRARGGTPLDVAAKLRLDHGALAELLVPAPTIAAARRAVLAAHNPLEEGGGGVYEICETLAGADAAAWLASLRATPEMPVHPHVDGPHIVAATQRARAGYDVDVTDESRAGGERGAHR
jgi:hypothetical protein